MLNVLGTRSGIATVLDIRSTKHGAQEVYISFAGADKRLDTWLKESEVGGLVELPANGDINGIGHANGESSKKRRIDHDVSEVLRHFLLQLLELSIPLELGFSFPTKPALVACDRSSTLVGVSNFCSQTQEGTPDRQVDSASSAPSTPEREHANATRVRNFEDVRFGEYLIKTWSVCACISIAFYFRSPSV